MAIPMAVVLGLACTFYVYVAVQWGREIMMIRRQSRRSSSAIVPLFVSQAEKREKGDDRREVIVMGRSKAGKHPKQIVA